MYSVEVISNPDSTFVVKAKDYEFLIGIQGKGMTPPDTLLASLASCIGVYIRKYAQGAKLNLENFSMKIEAELSKDAPVCFKEIKVDIDLKNVLLDERRKQALLAFIKNCPVHNTLEAKPEIKIEIGK